MQLTYNKFKQVVDLSSEKIFNQLTEAVATSDNVALVAMFDDKLVLLDEENNNLYLCNYVFDKKILTMHNFQPIELTENDSTFLNKVVDDYFSLEDETTVTVGDLMNGFRLKYKNESANIFTEAKDRKYRKIMESSRITAIKKARQFRDKISEDVKTLLEEPFMKNLTLKTATSKDSIPMALNKVAFRNPYPISVNTDIGGPAKDLLKLKDNTNVMNAMKGVALKISEKWKSDTFRKKFEQMVNKILQTESIELAQTAVLSFLEEHKEIFLLKEQLFNELITKTALMLNQTDTDAVLKIFEEVITNSKRGRMMKREYFNKLKIDENKLNEINSVADEGTPAATDTPVDGEEPSKKAGNDLAEEDLVKIIDIFKKIKDQMQEDSKEMDYINGIISNLEDVKTTGIEDSKMRDIIDFLNATGSTKEKESDQTSEEPMPDSDNEVQI